MAEPTPNTTHLVDQWDLYETGDPGVNPVKLPPNSEVAAQLQPTTNDPPPVEADIRATSQGPYPDIAAYLHARAFLAAGKAPPDRASEHPRPTSSNNMDGSATWTDQTQSTTEPYADRNSGTAETTTATSTGSSGWTSEHPTQTTTTHSGSQSGSTTTQSQSGSSSPPNASQNNSATTSTDADGSTASEVDINIDIDSLLNSTDDVAQTKDRPVDLLSVPLEIYIMTIGGVIGFVGAAYFGSLKLSIGLLMALTGGLITYTYRRPKIEEDLLVALFGVFMIVLGADLAGFVNFVL